MTAYPEFLGVSEATFQRTVMEFANLSGWRCAHFADSRREVVSKRTGARRLVGDHAAAGWPDLSMVRGRQLVFAELKTMKGRVSAIQDEWLAALRQVEATAGGLIIVRVWRPGDWPEIERTLR